jgi:hypothetical protein
VLRFLKSRPLILMLVLWSVWLTRGEAASQGFNQLLRGNYAFTGEDVCLVSPKGFDADFTPLGPTSVFSSSIQGLRTFNGDGTGSLIARTVPFNLPQPSRPGASGNSADLSADFTYEVASDRTFTVEQGPMTSTDTGEPNARTTVIIENIKFSGQISQDLKTLVMSTEKSTVETRKNLQGQILDYRICRSALGQQSEFQPVPSA